jgi:periplasmic copper chaperone A
MISSKFFNKRSIVLYALPLLLCATTSFAKTLPANSILVSDSWVRSTVVGQSVAGVYMKIKNQSKTPLTLISAKTGAAKSAEIHEMSMVNDVSKMRQITDGILLAPQQSVQLVPSGLHIMLMDLKRPITVGATASLTLVFMDSKKSRYEHVIELGAR